MKKIIIGKNDNGQRIDKFLKKLYPNVSKVLFIKWIRNKDIKINGVKCQYNSILQNNDEITIYFDKYLDNTKESNFLKSNDDLDIVYEDKNILIINKPIGLLSHPNNANDIDCLINRVKKYLYNKKEWDYENENSFEPSLINRIDYNTSGIIVVAKNYASLKELNACFKSRQVEKRYYALIHGIIPDNKWHETKIYISSDDEIVKCYKDYKPNTKVAITKYKRIKLITNNYSLIEIILITGRKHQIRATFNYLNMPIVGEKKYTNKNIKNDKYKTQCLISFYLKFKIEDKKSILWYLNKETFILNKIWFLD